jgi:hypothetical protein
MSPETQRIGISANPERGHKPAASRYLSGCYASGIREEDLL